MKTSIQEMLIRHLNNKVLKLEAFKNYVHKRLDDAGIETHPKGEHADAGCRIGQRLDLVLNPNQGWRKCSDGNPETFGKHLVINPDIWGKDLRTIGDYSFSTKTWFDEKGNVIYPTHWCPLPAAPAE